MPEENIQYKIGEMSGKMDILINVVNGTKTELLTSINKVADDFGKMERGRLTTLENGYRDLKIIIEADQKKEQKTSDKIWDVVKIAIPWLMMGATFLMTFWLNNK